MHRIVNGQPSTDRRSHSGSHGPRPWFQVALRIRMSTGFATRDRGSILSHTGGTSLPTGGNSTGDTAARILLFREACDMAHCGWTPAREYAFFPHTGHNLTFGTLKSGVGFFSLIIRTPQETSSRSFRGNALFLSSARCIIAFQVSFNRIVMSSTSDFSLGWKSNSRPALGNTSLGLLPMRQEFQNRKLFRTMGERSVPIS